MRHETRDIRQDTRDEEERQEIRDERRETRQEETRKDTTISGRFIHATVTTHVVPRDLKNDLPAEKFEDLVRWGVEH